MTKSNISSFLPQQQISFRRFIFFFLIKYIESSKALMVYKLWEPTHNTIVVIQIIFHPSGLHCASRHSLQQKNRLWDVSSQEVVCLRYTPLKYSTLLVQTWIQLVKRLFLFSVFYIQFPTTNICVWNNSSCGHVNLNSCYLS